MKKIVLLLITVISCYQYVLANKPDTKKVLIVTEGTFNLKSPATAEARQLADLMGHFNTQSTVIGVDQYRAGLIKQFDIICFSGFKHDIRIPKVFLNDVFKTQKTVIWLNSGLRTFEKKEEFTKKYGFRVLNFDKSQTFNSVTSGTKRFTRGVNDIYLIQVTDAKKVGTIAEAHSEKLGKTTPYIVRSGNLYYVADMPFLNATETDRYLLFADLLHDFIGENHPVKHHAIVRIEDVTPLDSPIKLHDIADILSERNIPFVIGLVPIYVNPAEGVRVSLSDRPELVEALKYCVQNGATICMHGVTHQYRGVSTDDFEFWDASTNKPIADENETDIANKIEMGINECIKNGIYPLLWETPHYAASILTYKTVAKFFSTAMEQRLAIENTDYGQYFPYLINHDIYGQKIYPEDLGYLPLIQKRDSSEKYIHSILEHANFTKNVRDGYAAFFFHSFLNLDYLKQIVDGMIADSLSFVDIRQHTNWVKTKDKVILSGSQSYTIHLDNSYLYEIYCDKRGKIKKKILSDHRISGTVTKNIKLEPGEFYVAQPLEHKIRDLSFKEKAVLDVKNVYKDLFETKIDWKEARVKACWNQFANGAGYNDQSSLVSMFQSVNINVDTLFMRSKLDLSNTNVLIVPYAAADSLTTYELNKIAQFVKQGGDLITDRKSRLSNYLGLKFLDTEIKVYAVRDNLYPQEHIAWSDGQLVHKFDTGEDDDLYALDASTGSALVVGRQYGNGKILYFSTAFDANSQLGYSRYPYGLEYAFDYFKVHPVIREDNLEFYFDPGYRKNTSIENSVKQWVKNGIHIVHVAAWHEWPKWTYDYGRLIKLAHANGILVIAWIEPPQVNKKFWDEHPQWREKNYLGKDAMAGWRYPEALTDSNCLKAATTEYIKLLKAYNWDGVNLAELYFDSDQGFADPDKYLPMHPSAIKAVKKKYGIDMHQIFDPFSSFYWKENSYVRQSITQYREDEITYLHRKLLDAFYAFAKTRPGFQIIVTTMDSYGSPELKDYNGINAASILTLQKQYGFNLQIEDPATRWSTDPSRYKKIGDMYAKKMGNRDKLMLDLNILAFRNKDEVTPFPTLIPTGIESYQLVNSASEGAPRSTIYSESSANPQDISLFPYASASFVEYRATAEGYEVTSPESFTLILPENLKMIKIDNLPVIGMRNNKFLIPAGNHTLTFDQGKFPGFSTVAIQPQILSFTGNLLSVKYAMRSATFDYTSQGRALVSLSEPPSKIEVDGKDIALNIMKGRDCFSWFVPAGTHTINVITGNSFSYGVNLTSLWSTNAIVIYGGIAIALIVIMYFAMKLIRRRYEV